MGQGWEVKVHVLKLLLTKVLNQKLANKVIHEVGLVIGVLDLLDIGTSFIFPGDGAAHTKVTFRVIVFR